MTATAGFYPPTLASYFSLDSTIEYEDAIVTVRASNGALRGRNFQSIRKAKFTLRHTLLDVAARNDVRSAYDLNRNRAFQLTFMGETFQCMWIAPLRESPVHGIWYDMELYCAEI
jgi:hypothetical protein